MINVFNCNVNVKVYHYCYILKCFLRIDSIQTTHILNWENWLINTLQKLLGHSSKKFSESNSIFCIKKIYKTYVKKHLSFFMGFYRKYVWNILYKSQTVKTEYDYNVILSETEKKS